MGVEIERKFLVESEGWRGCGPGVRYRQGYITADEKRSVRVRVAGREATITIKGGSVGAVREEFEYTIPVADAERLLDAYCPPPLIEKTRFRCPYKGLVWEIDEFFGANTGLVLAEVELDSEDREVSLPSWVGREVTGDPRYLNASLARRPFGSWRRE